MNGYEVKTERFLSIPATENFQQAFQFCYSKYQKIQVSGKRSFFQDSNDRKISPIQHRDLKFSDSSS